MSHPTHERAPTEELRARSAYIACAVASRRARSLVVALAAVGAVCIAQNGGISSFEKEHGEVGARMDGLTFAGRIDPIVSGAGVARRANEARRTGA
jgi:hypothetical protein